MRKSFRLAGIAAVTILAPGLSACGTKAPAPAASETAAPGAMGPAAPEGVSVSGATVKLPAVAGRPGAAYFTITQNGGSAHKLAAVHVDGVGRAEMHETVMAGGVSKMQPVKDVAVEPGKPLVFKPGGYHVMLFDVDASLKAGGTTELTVIFDNGDKASTPAKIAGAADMPAGEGANNGGMAGMDHM
ncbi:MAG: copper chaperone PCu(A)C [Sphingomonadales bacterium]|nr:copper chaperone PCu(A)C [Sphingomonadales bacterium]MDE2567305.1 copper chaperone PCu(A)C [Sphingomonadales bacterium]